MSPSDFAGPTCKFCVLGRFASSSLHAVESPFSYTSLWWLHGAQLFQNRVPTSTELVGQWTPLDDIVKAPDGRYQELAELPTRTFCQLL